MKLILLLVVICFGQSFLPRQVNIDSLACVGLPVLPDTLVSSKAVDFKPYPVIDGKNAGILLSERSSVKYIFEEAAYHRCQTEIYVMTQLQRQYYESFEVAEQIYQKKIADLEKSNQRSWFELNAGYVGYAAGIITSIAMVWAIDHTH
jgi:hypothetical protein